MMTLKTVRKMQDARKPVQLDDGRIGKIVRVDTTFPGNHTEVSVYTLGPGPGTAKVTLDRLFEAKSRTAPYLAAEVTPSPAEPTAVGSPTGRLPASKA
jgi:hypothetical protein